MMKQCNKCQVTKPLEDFQKRASNKDGHTGQCKKCKRDYDRQHYRKNPERASYIKKNREDAAEKTKAWYASYLQTKSCADCGQDDWRVLEADHVSGHKRDNIARLLTSSLKAVQEELKHCEIVCANCHRIRTITRGDGWRTKF